MLREEYIRNAAAVHIEGARLLRDSAAALLPCCTLFSVDNAFSLQRALGSGENLLNCALDLSTGLCEKSALTKYTAVTEARMRLLGVTLDGSVSSKQAACERAKIVPPGTRGDVYEGFIALSARAQVSVNEFLATLDRITLSAREGTALYAVPVSAIGFLYRACADYGAACGKLAAGEAASLVKRADEYEQYKKCLQLVSASEGADTLNASADTLAALASGGLIPSLPPVLFDILLRYENLPPAVRNEYD